MRSSWLGGTNLEKNHGSNVSYIKETIHPFFFPFGKLFLHLAQHLNTKKIEMLILDA